MPRIREIPRAEVEAPIIEMMYKFLFAERDTIPNVSERIYPDYHAAFLREARVEGTGTLYFPGRGEKRVRLKRMASSQVLSLLVPP